MSTLREQCSEVGVPDFYMEGFIAGWMTAGKRIEGDGSEIRDLILSTWRGVRVVWRRRVKRGVTPFPGSLESDR
jgi:hypothetical protein